MWDVLKKLPKKKELSWTNNMVMKECQVGCFGNQLKQILGNLVAVTFRQTC